MKNILGKTGFAMIFAAGTVAFSFGQAVALSSHTHQVKCDKGKSLQQAVDNAHSGDTLLVSGTCTENVTIRVDQISLIGTGGAAIDPADTSTATVSVLATNVRIRGFTITVGTDRQAIIVRRGGSARIEDNTITGTGKTGATTGILVTDNGYARIGGRSASLRNTITDHRRGITVRLGGGADIFFNTLDDNDRGINLNNNGSADVSDNTISNNTRGLSLNTSASVALSGSTSSTGGANTFTGNTIAIRCRLGGAVSNDPPPGVQQIDGGGNVGLVSASGCHVTSNALF